MDQSLVVYGESNFGTEILAGNVAPSTIKMYERDFQAYLEYAGSREAALNPSTLARWRAHLSLNTQMSPNTINRMLASVRSVMRAAAEQRYISRELAEDFKAIRGVKPGALKNRTKDTARTYIAPEEMRRMVEAPGTETLVGLRDTALLLTLSTSGLRASEVVSLKKTQITRRGREYIMRVQGKNDDKPRGAYLSREAYTAIHDWLNERGVESEYIFTAFDGRGDRLTARPITTGALWLIVRKYADAVGLEHVKTHDLRRFVGTQLAQTNAREAQLALGHKHINTTFDHYVLDDLKPGLTNNLF